MTDDIENKKDGNNVLCLGIDLGTSWIAVMTNRGDKIRFRSVVGHPTDIIARNVVGKDILVGEEALENRGSLSLRFPLQEGVINIEDPNDVEAATELLSYVVSLTRPKLTDTICGIIGVPAQAPAKASDVLLGIAADELHKAVVVSEPFLVGFGQDALNSAIIVDIGAGTTDVCGLKGVIPGPDDQISIPNAGDHIDKMLMKAIEEKYPGVQLTTNLVRKIKEKHAVVGESRRLIQVEFRSSGVPRRLTITNEVRKACESILPDLLDAIKSVLAGFDLERQDAALQNIYLSGGGSMIRGIDKVIAKELGEYGEARVKRVSDPFFAGCEGALKLCAAIPAKEWHRIGKVGPT